MDKKFSPLLLLILLIGLSIGLCGCSKAKTIIVFNHDPITKENILNNANEFSKDKRIYYIFITEKKLPTTEIRIRVIKREEKANFSLGKIVYSNDFRLYKDQMYYYNDYIRINEAGYYLMAIYMKSNMARPIAVADFQVK